MTGNAPADALKHAIAASPWAYPAAEIVHICGFILVVGPVVAFDLRLLGVTRAGSVSELARALLPWSIIGACIAVSAGLVLFASDASAILSNPAFRVKMLLLSLALTNAIAFHATSYRAAKACASGEVPGAIPKVHAALSIVLWIGVISAGRAIAYV